MKHVGGHMRVTKELLNDAEPWRRLRESAEEALREIFRDQIDAETEGASSDTPPYTARSWDGSEPLPPSGVEQ